MGRNSRFLVIAAALVLFVLGLLLAGLDFLRAATGLVFVLLLPGWAISAAVFPNRELGFPERVALVCGFSLAAVMLSGLALHLTPWGLQTWIWLALLVVITFVAGFAASLRQRPAGFVPATQDARMNPLQVGLVVLAVMVVGVAISIARQPTPAAGFEGYTSLWIHPVEVEGGQALQVGVGSMEFAEAGYHLELRLAGRLFGEFPEVTLSPGESTSFVVRLDAEQLQEGPVEALLYRLDKPGEVYRQVTWWP